MNPPQDFKHFDDPASEDVRMFRIMLSRFLIYGVQNLDGAQDNVQIPGMDLVGSALGLYVWMRTNHTDNDHLQSAKTQLVVRHDEKIRWKVEFEYDWTTMSPVQIKDIFGQKNFASPSYNKAPGLPGYRRATDRLHENMTQLCSWQFRKLFWQTMYARMHWIAYDPDSDLDAMRSDVVNLTVAFAP
jgi:hypothetical protein